MKKLLLSLILMVFAGSISAQSLSFKYEGETVEASTIDIVTNLNSSMEIQFDLHILNTTDAEINVVCEMEDNSGIGQNYLCWGTCFMPGILKAEHTLAGGEEGLFNGHCMFVDNDGNTLPAGTTINMVYTFYDKNNPEEKYVFNVNFTYEAPALSFKYEGETIEASTIDIVTNLNSSMEIQFDLHILNTTDAEINVVCEMEDNSGIGQNYLCWGTCFMPGILKAEHTLAGGEEGLFNGHCMFVDNDGNTLPAGTTINMVYTFYDKNNPEEKYVFNVNFTYEEDAIADFNSIDVFSNAYPNPANNVVSFDYNMPFDVKSASVAIYNMMGQEVVKQNLNLGSSRTDINVSDLAEGVYFYSLIVNNQTVKTNKLVVSR